jgi:hydrogenase large subunit
LTTFVNSGQLGLFGGGYWGHPAYQLAPEENLLMMAHYLEALDWQREAVKIHAYLGGKNPHPQTYVVGGMTTPLDPTSPTAVNTSTLESLRRVAESIVTFVEQVYVPDLMLLGRAYPSWAAIGQGPGNLLCVGDFPDAGGRPLMPAGLIRGKDLSRALPVDQRQITEDVTRAWYASSSPKHPSVGVTQPQYTGPTPPYEFLNTNGKYSWGKAPRYGGAVMEVGPLARMMVAYASGDATARSLVDGAVGQMGLPPEAMFSTIGRMVARALETQWLAGELIPWIDELQGNLSRGDLTVCSTTRTAPSSWPSQAAGVGFTEAPRGALGHWVRITERKIANYQIVIPSTWNGSPRDAGGQRGAWEQALVGVQVHDAAQPLEVVRVVHSFDPCMACAVHVLDAEGSELAHVTVVP